MVTEQLKAMDFTSKIQVEQFIESGTWRFVAATIEAAIEDYRTQLEAVSSVDELRLIQGKLAMLHYFLIVPSKLVEQLTEEMENAEREQAGTTKE